MSNKLIHEWEHEKIGSIRIIDRAEEGEPVTPVVEVDHPGVCADIGEMQEAGLLVDALGEEIARLVAERSRTLEMVRSKLAEWQERRSKAFNLDREADYASALGAEEGIREVLALLAEPGEEMT